MSAILPLTEQELSCRIQKSFERLCEPYYQIDQVFAPPEYDWPGDKEGRALLAFACHAQMTGNIVPCMPLMRAQLDEKTNEHDFFGPLAEDIIFEQQLSSHSWYLRALCAVYRLDKSPDDLRRMTNVFEHLFLPTKGRFATYPIHRTDNGGGVSGHTAGIIDGWRLSTDIGCAFMSVDGLSDYYEITRDARALALLDEMIDVFVAIDKVALQAQTHCSLTAARGMLRLYRLTGDKHYLDSAYSIWNTYLHDGGMTYTYQNFNWWGKGDTWTEPCAIVDSLMVATQLYELVGDEEALTLARRIWHNGLASSQRPNGGAGTETTVSDTCDTLKADLYEAEFCCTMRFAEGLLCAKTHRDLLDAQLNGQIEKDALGRYHDGDLLYGEILDGVTGLPEQEQAVTVDGHILTPLVKYYRLTKEQAASLRQKILF